MTTMFKPAIRENVGLLIGLAGGTGSGKTFSALRLAKGMSGGKAFALIDTEARRALHYADQFKFDHAELRAPFTPNAYADAICAADAAGYPVIVVDSTSHVWSGDGGVLDWQEQELTRMAGTDWQKREACKMASWIKPKVAHKHMVQKLLQVRAHLILCFRAEEKIEMVKEGGKMVIRPMQSRTGLDGWIPICEKTLPFELTASFLLTAAAPGVPHPIKLQEQHRALFPKGTAIDEGMGQAVAAWARGGVARPAAIQSQQSSDDRASDVDPSSGNDTISAEQIAKIEEALNVTGIAPARLLINVSKIANTTIDMIADIPADLFDRAFAWINKVATPTS